MKNIVIIEDEQLAAEKLERYLLKYNSELKIIVVLSSISDAVHWLNTHTNYDVVFMDIQLTDGLSFEIFNQTKILKPVIFTTAFDEYAVDAFKVNSIDYVLKPITFTDIARAMKKLKSMHTLFNPVSLSKIVEVGQHKKVKDRFLVRLGNHIKSIKTEEIALFFADGRTVYLATKEGKKFIVDFKLEDLNSLLSAKMFFRVNRSFIINISAIKDVIVYSNSRLKIVVVVNSEKEIIVSRDKVAAFKTWLEGI
ncbi:LytR/AlgR family response regulator transcription factor [Polaribacter sp.]|uniref:LytR/AlgR family response regulator transcription factor n=1 Tax=Polaribacter sp. TaxID=1920175 RepID=UPI003F6BD1D5